MTWINKDLGTQYASIHSSSSLVCFDIRVTLDSLCWRSLLNIWTGYLCPHVITEALRKTPISQSDLCNISRCVSNSAVYTMIQLHQLQVASFNLFYVGYVMWHAQHTVFLKCFCVYIILFCSHITLLLGFRLDQVQGSRYGRKATFLTVTSLFASANIKPVDSGCSRTLRCNSGRLTVMLTAPVQT